MQQHLHALALLVQRRPHSSSEVQQLHLHPLVLSHEQLQVEA
jgi:hypothetical protein